MLVKEIIQRIQSLYSKGVQSDDSRLTPRHIYNKMKSVRNMLLHQRLNKNQFISRWSYQTLQCVKLTKVPIWDCPCIPPVGCKVYRTENRILKPLSNMNQHIISSVTSIDGKIEFSETSWEAQKYKAANKYTPNKPDYFIKDGYMYFIGKDIPNMVTITALFENPEEVDTYSSYCEDVSTDCLSPLDREFPIEAEDIESLIKLCEEELVTFFSKAKEDIRNDTRDNLLEDTK